MNKYVFTGVAGAVLFAGLLPADAGAIEPTIATGSPSVSLACSVSPGSEFWSLEAKNNQASKVPAGTVVRWTAGTKSGSETLSKDLAPGAVAIVGQGSAPAPATTCAASFSAGKPDLAVKSAKWTNNTTVTVELQNLNSFAGAGSSITRVQVIGCGQTRPKATKDAAGITLGKGETKTQTFTFPSGTGVGAFLRVTADATQVVGEKNESNNVLDLASQCIH